MTLLVAWMPAALLALLGLLAALGAAGHGRVMQAGVALVSAGCLGLAVAVLAGGPAPAVLLPFGPPWSPLSLGLDGLAAWFLLLLGLAGLAAALASWAAADTAPRRLMLWPLLLAGLALTLFAADLFGLLLGFTLAGLAGHALLSAEGAWAEDAALARLDFSATLLAASALAVVAGLLAGLTGDLSFAGLRALPPAGGTALAVLLLVLPAAAARAVLPLLAPLRPGPALLLVGGAMPPVAVYLAARLLLDLGGPAQPLWWGAPLLAAGAVAAVWGALRALARQELAPILAGVALAHLGLVAMALGLSAALRAADLGTLAAVAAGAALLLLLAQALFLASLWLAAALVTEGTGGARHLDRLGGLVHAMPRVAWAALAAVGGAALLPPLSGYAGAWMLAQALFAAWRVGEPLFQLLAVFAVAALGLSGAVLAAALLRLWGLTFLGRPRTPRTLGSPDAAPLPLGLLLALAGLGLVVGLLPGLLLRLAAPGLQLLAGHAGAPELGLYELSAGPAAAGYLPLAVAVGLVLALAVLGAVLHHLSPRPATRVAPWDDGFIAPPPHLPFGDPATQPGTAALAIPMRPPLPRLRPWPGWPALPGVLRLPPPRPGTVRRALRLCLGTVAALLVLLVWLGGGA